MGARRSVAGRSRAGSGLPVLVCLTAALSRPFATWQIEPMERDALLRIATQLVDAASPPVGELRAAGLPPEALRLVGWRARAGQAELYFHGERALDRRHLAHAARHLPGVVIRCSERDDPRWTFYLESLHPGPALDPLLLTAVQLEERQRCGDDHAVPRAVDHLVRFRDPRDRQRFAELLREVRQDWDVRPFEADGERRFGLECTAEHSLQRWVIDAHVIALAGRADELGGVYDGWGAPRVGRRERSS